MSTFNSTDLFGDCPHRFTYEPMGLLAPLRLSIGVTAAGSAVLGPLEFAVIARGRLVEGSDADLQSRLELIQSLLTFPVTTGDLVDNQSNTYADMSFIKFTPGDRIDRGRKVTLAFEARFVRLYVP